MTTVAIIAKSLGKLMVDISIERHEPMNAWFAATGNELPYNMWMKLVNSSFDMMQAQEEVERYNG